MATTSSTFKTHEENPQAQFNEPNGGKGRPIGDKAREAASNFTDKAKNDGDSQTVRYATRWNLEKRDPSLKLSPPKTPITYYIRPAVHAYPGIAFAISVVIGILLGHFLWGPASGRSSPVQNR